MEIRDHPTLKSVIRFDSTPLSRAYYTEEGYLVDSPILTSVGIFEYANPDGSIRRELRVPSEVFSKESLESYRGKPIIITHDAGLVDKNNVHDASIGTILSDGYRDGSDVRAKIVIHDTDEMKERGFKELSLGYNLDLDETPGIYNGEHYDAIQRNIRINHLALVREARAGDQARLNIDSKDGETLVGGKKLMSKKIRNARRADEALTPEELKKAIEWYKANRDQFENKDADDVQTEESKIEDKIANIRDNHPVEAEKEAVAEEKVAPEKKLPEKKPIPEKKPVVEEEQMDEDEEVVSEEEMTDEFSKDADEVIRDQDKDIKTLLDIIDTLLAEKAFDEAEPEVKEKEEEELTFDADDWEEKENCDADDDDIPTIEGFEEIPEDEATDVDVDVHEDEEDDEDEEEEVDIMKYEEKPRMNVDSVDKIIRERIKLGMLGRALNLDGLENMSVLKAKKTIIKAVRPSMRLDGKSYAYINAAYQYAAQDIKKSQRKTTNDQRKKMFNKDSAIKRDENTPESARQRMIERRQNKKEENK